MSERDMRDLGKVIDALPDDGKVAVLNEARRLAIEEAERIGYRLGQQDMQRRAVEVADPATECMCSGCLTRREVVKDISSLTIQESSATAQSATTPDTDPMPETYHELWDGRTVRPAQEAADG